MEVKDLKPRMGNVDLVLTVTEKGLVREFDKFGKKGYVCNLLVEDGTGRVSLTLWNEDTDKVGEGDKIELKNGWVGEYQGELQLSTGKFGEVKVLEKGQPKKKEEPKKYKDDDDPEPVSDEEVVDDE